MIYVSLTLCHTVLIAYCEGRRFLKDFIALHIVLPRFSRSLLLLPSLREYSKGQVASVPYIKIGYSHQGINQTELVHWDWEEHQM